MMPTQTEQAWVCLRLRLRNADKLSPHHGAGGKEIPSKKCHRERRAAEHQEQPEKMISVQAEEAFDESDDNKIDIKEVTTSENIERIKDSDQVAITFNATEEEEVTISGDIECVKLSRAT